MRHSLKVIFKLSIIALISVCFQNCEKDSICAQEEKCENFPTPDGGVSVVSQKPYQRHAPCFNPNNANEIIYVKNSNYKYQLVKYNLQTKSETILLENTFIVGQPKWGKNGWIVFSKLDLNVYLIKENGDSMKRISSYYQNNHPSFLGDNKIFTSVSVETSPGAAGNKIIDIFGNRIDSFKISDLQGMLWVNHINGFNEICGSYKKDNQLHLSLLKYPTKELNHLTAKEFSGRNEITGIFWHPNNQDIYYSTLVEGLYKINKNSKKETKIKCGCDTRSYRSLSISPEGNKIIVERFDATDFQNKSGSWTEEAKIVIMNIDGSDEKIIFE